MILSERIQRILDYADMNPTEFARNVGFPTPQTVRELLKGNTKSVSEAVKFRINSYFPEINLDWLVSGEGNMFISSPDPSSEFYDEWNDMKTLRERQAKHQPDQKNTETQEAPSDLTISELLSIIRTQQDTIKTLSDTVNKQAETIGELTKGSQEH